MSNPLGAILAGLAGGASTLGTAMDDREKLDELKKERAANALRQLAKDALDRQQTLSQMGAVLDTGKPTRGDVMSGIQDTGGSFAVPTGLGSGDATGAIQALAQAKQTEQNAPRFQLPDAVTGNPTNYRIDEEQTPEARAMRRLIQQQRGQQSIEDSRIKAAEARAEAARVAADARQAAMLKASEERQQQALSAAERRAGWSIQKDAETGRLARVNAITGEVHPVDVPYPTGGAGSAGAAGGKQTDAQKKANALLMMAQQAQEGLDGKEGPQTLAEAVESPKDKAQKLGEYRPSWLTQQASRFPLGVGNLLTPDKLQQQQQYALQLSDAWLRYTSGAAVPESEVQRFASTFTPQAGDTDAKTKQKKLARKMIIDAMRAGVGYAAQPTNAPYQLPFQKGAAPSAPPDGQVNPYLVP